MKGYEPKPVHGFSVEELKTLRHIIDMNWNSVADDLFSASQFPNNDVPDYYNRYEVAEISLDVRSYSTEGDEKIIEKLRELGWHSDKWEEVINQALPYEKYGY